MKKAILFISSFLLLTSCSNVNKENNDSNDLTIDSNKVLISYFSATGNTKRIANVINNEISGDIYEIQPLIPYSIEDLDYLDSESRVSKENNDESSRPEIGSDKIENFNDYNYIFLGYPIWFGKAPKIIYTFLESYDFNNKIIIPFVTSSSSGIGSSAINLEELTSNSTWMEGRRFSGNENEEVIKEWTYTLDI